MFRRMSRIRSLVAFGAVLASAVCSAADIIIYVKPGATGEGTSWDDPAELTAALAKAAPAKVSAEVWLQEGTYEMTADSPVYMFWNKTAVRGGFKGTETSPAERPSGTMSTIDGCKTYQTLNCYTFGKDALFERICFYRSSRTGFNKYKSSGDVTFVDCSFVANGTDYGSNLNGRGAGFEGDYHTETVSLTNCVFAGNTADPTLNIDIATGYGAFFRNLKEAVLVNCLFVTNGCNWARTADTSVRTSCGLAFRADNTKVTARGCRFVANAGFPGSGVGVVELQNDCDGSLFENCLWAGNRLTRDISYNGYVGGLVLRLGSIERTVTVKGCTFVGNALNEQNMDGGIVALRGNCDGTAFTNCAWIANECLYDGVYTPGRGSGALVVKADTAARRVDVQNCTFAYNISDASESPADLNVILGDVTVGNSIFWGEVTNVNNCVGKAIHVQTGASCHVDYSLLGAAEDASAAADALLMVEHGLVGDPRFVYGFVPYTNALSRASYKTNIGTYNRICLPADFATSIEPNLNIHLRGGSGYVDEVMHVQTRAPGRTSIAVDAGDPLSDYSNETIPNGRRVNLGRYGNTPWATMARPATVIFVY